MARRPASAGPAVQRPARRRRRSAVGGGSPVARWPPLGDDAARRAGQVDGGDRRTGARRGHRARTADDSTCRAAAGSRPIRRVLRPGRGLRRLLAATGAGTGLTAAVPRSSGCGRRPCPACPRERCAARVGLGRPDGRCCASRALWRARVARRPAHLLNARVDQVLPGCWPRSGARDLRGRGQRLRGALLPASRPSRRRCCPPSRAVAAAPGRADAPVFRAVMLLTPGGRARRVGAGPGPVPRSSATRTRAPSSRSCGCCRARSASPPARVLERAARVRRARHCRRSVPSWHSCRDRARPGAHPALGAAGAAVAASVALLTGGAVAAAAYRSQTGFGWSELVPRPRDARTLRLLARRALRARRPA